MAAAAKLLARMRANPRDDWRMADIAKVAAWAGLAIRTTGGSHHVVTSPHLRDALCIPHKRPIKQRYVKQFVALVESHRAKDSDHE
jgi:hypothetical protein